MRQMLSDTLDASRPVTMSPDARRQVDRRMHALMELFSDKHMNQDFIRLRQATAAAVKERTNHGMRVSA